MSLQVDDFVWVHNVLGVKGEFELLHDFDGVLPKLLNQEVPLTETNTMLTSTCTTNRHGSPERGREGGRGGREREREREVERKREEEERERERERERCSDVCNVTIVTNEAHYG